MVLKRTFAHIINLFDAPSTSDLKLAQEVTVASMVKARNTAIEDVSVELLSAQANEDRHLISNEFRCTADLATNVQDFRSFDKKLELPILRDILDRAFNESEADYIIFTNADIGVQPHFYQKVNEFIEDGHDAFMINRRRISAKFNSVNELEQMYAEKGLKHPGFDCFVFKRDLYPKFSLANVCIGVPFIGITLSQNIFCFAENPKAFTDEYLTFQIGLEIFKKRAPKEFLSYNRQEFWKAMREIWPNLNTKKWPHGNTFVLARLVRWGLHPCFPIRLALKLEPRRWIS